MKSPCIFMCLLRSDGSEQILLLPPTPICVQGCPPHSPRAKTRGRGLPFSEDTALDCLST